LLLQKARGRTSIAMTTPRLLPIGVLIVAVSCMQCQPEYYVPTQQEVRERLAPFIVPDASNVQPRYKNPDVDSMIATYCFPRSTRQVFADIERRSGADWTLRAQTLTRLSFDRYTDGGEVKRYEIVEVRASGPQCVTLAWLEADGVTPETYERSSVRQWSRREFWPHVDRFAQEIYERNKSR
jgi:hypothetical protein